MLGNPLSDRELEIVKLVAEGHTSEQISEKLFLSVFTVNTHRRNTLKKAGFNTISDLIYDFQARRLI